MSLETANLIAEAFGTVLPFFLVGLGIAVYQKRRRRTETLPKQPIVVSALLGAMVAIMLYVQRTAPPAAEAEAEVE